MLPGPKDVVEPHKELRFTRGRQATQFAVLGAIALGAAIAVFLLYLIPKDPIVPWWYALLPLPLAGLFFRLALRCVRHAYIILTPLGIELFPFFHARKNLQVLYWSQIEDAEVNERDQLVIHLNEEQTAGIVASLAPVRFDQRDLLSHAIDGRMEARHPERFEERTGD